MARPVGTKYIETPEKMWELFEEYRTLTKQSPRYRTQFVGRDGVMVKEPLERPLTLEGFECYVFELGIINDLSHYFANTNGAYNDYLTICSRIKKAIRKDQIEGGMVGQYNPSITQRLNNLVEKTENKNEHSGTINANFGNPIQPPHQTTDNT
jgi:hypothetical protein